MTRPTPTSYCKSLMLSADSGRGVLLLHGLSSSPQELQFIARGLQLEGYTVSVPTLKGYSVGSHAKGGAAGVGEIDNACAATVNDWVLQANAALEALKKTCHSVAVGGLCIGATLALRLAQLHPQSVNALLCLSTTLYYDGWANPWYSKLLPLARIVPFAGRINIKEAYPYGVKDERKRKWIEAQMQATGYSVAGAGFLSVESLLKARMLIQKVLPDLGLISCPIILIHAIDDECASPKSARQTFAAVSSKSKKIVLLDNCYHMISIDLEKQKVLNELTLFLKQCPQLSADL